MLNQLNHSFTALTSLQQCYVANCSVEETTTGGPQEINTKVEVNLWCDCLSIVLKADLQNIFFKEALVLSSDSIMSLTLVACVLEDGCQTYLTINSSAKLSFNTS